MSTCTFTSEGITSGTFREREIQQLRFSHTDELHVLQMQRNADLLEQLLTVAYEKKLQVVIVKIPTHSGV